MVSFHSYFQVKWTATSGGSYVPPYRWRTLPRGGRWNGAVRTNERRRRTRGPSYVTRALHDGCTRSRPLIWSRYSMVVRVIINRYRMKSMYGNAYGYALTWDLRAFLRHAGITKRLHSLSQARACCPKGDTRWGYGRNSTMSCHLQINSIWFDIFTKYIFVVGRNTHIMCHHNKIK